MLVCKKWHVAKRMLTPPRTGCRCAGSSTCSTRRLPGAASGRDRADAGEAQPPPPRADADAVRLLRHRPADDLPRPGQYRPDARFHVRPGQCAILELQCVFDDQYLVGHARRVGLATDQTPDEVIERMLPTLRHEFADQSVRIREAEFQHHWRCARIATRAKTRPCSAIALTSTPTPAMPLPRHPIYSPTEGGFGAMAYAMTTRTSSRRSCAARSRTTR
jgi:hypothetical protein